MYTDNDLSISTRRANMTRSFVESAIKSYKESNSIKETSKNNYNNGAMVFESVMHKEGIRNRYHSFVESVKSSLVIDCLYNIFENAILPERPIAAELKETLLKNGALGALMSGSGTAVFGIFDDESLAFDVVKNISKLGHFACLTTPVDKYF